ncbi:hypothetical protein M569_02599, partial [Genlisea aurea]
SGSKNENGSGNSNADSCILSSTFAYFIISFIILGSAGSLFGKYMLSPGVRTGIAAAVGCQEDDEGSWAVGVFYGDSPLSLKPIEDMNVWNNETAAWPVANPVLTCASLSDAGFPSNFVADPFLYVQGDVLYLFFETKNPTTRQGDIGVAKSVDGGATWRPIGIALDEEWHLSYPYVFEYDGNIYMMPESSEKGDLRLYRATEFPLKWTLEKVVMRKPMVDAFIIRREGKFWIFGSDHSRIGSVKNGELEIWHSHSLSGHWRPHRGNPIRNGARRLGARNGGRPFVYNGSLYRIGQDCGETYGRGIRVFRVEVLTGREFREVEVEVPSVMAESRKRRNAWNGVRSHHLDVQRLSSGKWIAVLDGDRVPSGDRSRRLVLGSLSVAAVSALVVFFGVAIRFVRGVVPLSLLCPYDLGKRSDSVVVRERTNNLPSRVRVTCSRLNRAALNLRSKARPNTCMGATILLSTAILALGLTCVGVTYIYGGNGAQEAYPIDGGYSQFTLVAMTYDARIWNLKIYVKHYSRCSSVREIVVVWNKGVPPRPEDFDSAVPVRVRVEGRNSLNNRFKADPLIATRGVLELDDDIIVSCNDVERGFLVWRRNPEKIVGFYPRYVSGEMKYLGERHAREHGGYNVILTGAAFMDAAAAFGRYGSDVAAEGRAWVEANFNCEDVLMNFLYANATAAAAESAVEYVRPSLALETSKLSGVAISKDTQTHYDVRSKCIAKFSEIYGGLSHRKSEFGRRKDGWDL